MIQMTKKRRLAFLLAGLLLASALTACGKTDKTSAETTTSIPTASGTETTQENMAYTEELPKKDFDGKTFNFLLYGDGDPVKWSVVDVIGEEENGEVINDAIFYRNREVEERFNVKIEGHFDLTAPALIDASVRSGDDTYQAVWLQMSAAATSAQKGLFYDLKELTHINMSKSYWDQSIIRDLSIGNKVYYLTGDISTIDNQATWMMMFNKNMIQKYDMESPYELVKSGTWTIDKFSQMVKNASSDVNGDGKYDQFDQYGLSTTNDTIYGLFYSCNEKFVTKDEDDYPVLDINQDKIFNILGKTVDIMKKDHATLSAADIKNTANSIVDVRNAFEQDRAVFYAEVMFHIAMLRQMETDFGIIPLPKYDEAQEHYVTFVNPAATLLSVPVTNTDLEFTGIILEAMAASSYRYLTPAYYDIALKGKYARDDESSAMLDLLLQNRVYDLGLIYNWDTFAASYNGLAAKGDTNFASLLAKKEKSVQKAIDKFVEAFQTIE